MADALHGMAAGQSSKDGVEKCCSHQTNIGGKVEEWKQWKDDVLYFLEACWNGTKKMLDVASKSPKYIDNEWKLEKGFNTMADKNTRYDLQCPTLIH